MRPPLLRERDRVRPSSFLAPLPSEERGRGRGGGFTNKRAISPQKPTHTNPGDSERAREGYDARAREVWSPQSRKLPWPRAGRGSGSSPPVTEPSPPRISRSETPLVNSPQVRVPIRGRFDPASSPRQFAPLPLLLLDSALG
jgi:hypothetical protein